MDQLWYRFEQWLKLNIPNGLAALNPPASDRSIIHLELKLDCTFPPALVESLKCHNGQRHNAPKLFDGMELLSLDRIEDEWEVWSELWSSGDFSMTKIDADPEIKTSWWNPKWIPILYNGAGDHVCVDLDPANHKTAKAGQLLTMWHDRPERQCIATGFEVWFESYLNGLEQRAFQFCNEYGGIVAAK